MRWLLMAGLLLDMQNKRVITFHEERLQLSLQNIKNMAVAKAMDVYHAVTKLIYELVVQLYNYISVSVAPFCNWDRWVS